MTTSIICGKCRETHGSVDAIRACYAGNLHKCDWLVERTVSWFDEETGDGEGYDVIEDCGAEAIVTDRGFTCAAGHEHTYAEIRHAEGWDYAEDPDEAARLARAGTEPRDLVTAGPFRY